MHRPRVWYRRCSTRLLGESRLPTPGIKGACRAANQAAPARRDVPKRRTSLAAEKALELDPYLPEAHGSLAYVLAYDTWDWAGAEREYRRGFLDLLRRMHLGR